MGATINDVAKIAGVSASTVSRVLSDNPRISEETKQRVRKAVDELNYYPHAIARSLANSSTKTIGLILNTEADSLIRNPFFVQALTGVSLYAQENGYNVMFAFNKHEEEDLNIAMRYVSSRSVDGIILFTSRTNDKCINFLKKKKFPFSIIGRPDETKGVLWVDNDNFQATYQVTDFLISKGHSSIAFIGGPLGLNVSRDRLEGFKRAMSIHGVSPDKSILFDSGEFSDDFGYDCAMKIISAWEAGQNKPTAVVTCDDMQALGVLKAMQEKNIGDMAVTGFNNTPLGLFQSPKLTSVDVNADKLGFYAAKVLLDFIEAKESAPTHYIVPTNLVERESAV
ncbi:MAG: LacI family transcriptional regulator [Clostridia bacterium]|nr:LacI family transcriptional regulator [Clostridia bacterium]